MQKKYNTFLSGLWSILLLTHMACAGKGGLMLDADGDDSRSSIASECSDQSDVSVQEDPYLSEQEEEDLQNLRDALSDFVDATSTDHQEKFAAFNSFFNQHIIAGRLLQKKEAYKILEDCKLSLKSQRKVFLRFQKRLNLSAEDQEQANRQFSRGWHWSPRNAKAKNSA